MWLSCMIPGKSNSPSIQGCGEEAPDGILVTWVDLCKRAQRKGHPILGCSRSSLYCIVCELLRDNSTLVSRRDVNPPKSGTRGDSRSHYSGIWSITSLYFPLMTLTRWDNQEFNPPKRGTRGDSRSHYIGIWSIMSLYFLLNTSHDYVYESCNHVLINEKYQTSDWEGTTLKVLTVIHKWESMKT